MRCLICLLALIPGMACAQTSKLRVHVRVVGDTTWTEGSDGSAIRTVQRGDTVWVRHTGFPTHPDYELRWIVNGSLATRKDTTGQTISMPTFLATGARRTALETAARNARLRALHVPDVP